MKSKLFACALAAGMAVGTGAMAEPVAKQAGGQIEVLNPVGEALPMAKGMIPGHARFHYVTREWTILRMPTMGEEQTDTLRGPGPNLIWAATDPSGWYWDMVGSAWGVNEIIDGGVLCGDPLTVMHTISGFTFQFQTETLAEPEDGDPDLGVSINIYWNYDVCAVGPNGGVADFGGDCRANDFAQFDITDMPGSIDGVTPAAWIIDIDLTGGGEIVVPAGQFGYSYHSWVGYVTPTGPTLAAQNQITGPGMEVGLKVYTAAPQAVPLIGVLTFGGGAIFGQHNFQLFSTDTICDQPVNGACCVGEVCSIAADQAACEGLGGVFSLATPCVTFFCLPAPANDECLNAEVISGFGTFAYDNRAATNDGPTPLPGCAIPVGHDVWFSWQAPCSGDVHLTTCLYNTTDDAFAVYQGNNCGDLNNQIVCDDDGCTIDGGPVSATFTVSAGTNYLIRMCTWNTLVGGENFFELSNIDCSGEPPAFCDADWCHDGSVGVPDIFCFLSAWFSNDPVARCYGGTCDVPAIFAFLSIWFATGQGPCTP